MEQSKIVVVGSLNMDIVVSMPRLPGIGETISGTAVHYVSGGKGANQALGCSRLTADTVMIGCVGNDPFGNTIRKGMETNGVSLNAIKVVPDMATGTAHISHTPEDNCIVVVAGANEACTAATVKEHEAYLHNSAVVLAQLEVPLEAVQEAFSIANGHGKATVLNPAPARQLPTTLLEMTDYLTPNESEWEVLYGQPLDTEQQLEQSLAAWEQLYDVKVIVTRGEKGCSFLENGRLNTIPAPQVNVVDTTGAGDAFNAAFAYGISLGWTIGESAAFAVKAASLSVQTFGAQDGMPTLDQINDKR